MHSDYGHVCMRIYIALMNIYDIWRFQSKFSGIMLCGLCVNLCSFLISMTFSCCFWYHILEYIVLPERNRLMFCLIWPNPSE